MENHIRTARERIAKYRGCVAAGGDHIIGLKADGTVVAAGENSDGQCYVGGWRDIVAVFAGGTRAFGLREGGTLDKAGVSYTFDYLQGKGVKINCDVSGWRDITSVSAGDHHVVGLSVNRLMGSGISELVADIHGWRDMVLVSLVAGGAHTVGLKSDGTVVATGKNNKGQCDVSGWSDIIEVSAGGRYSEYSEIYTKEDYTIGHTVGLKSDGTVVATGYNRFGQCDVSGWRDIVSVSAGNDHTVGLKADGTVVRTGSDENAKCKLSDWRDIVSISAGGGITAGLKADGTVVVDRKYHKEVGDWRDIGPVSKESKERLLREAQERLLQEEKRREERRLQVEQWKSQGLCEKCGGQMRPWLFIFKKCQSCG
jgi:hypothetical protein